MKTLRSQLALFDGKHTDVLERLAVSIAEDPRALVRRATIAEEGPDDRVAVAATWVILALLQDRRGVPAGRAVVVRLVRVLEHTDR